MVGGILDISHHQTLSSGAFHAMKDAGIRAVIFKATQGTTYRDPEFEGWLDRARKVGLLTGAYHFGTKGDPEGQAEHFYRTAKGAGLLVLDWEGNGMFGTMRRHEAALFVSALKGLTGKHPVLYSGEAFLRSHCSNPTGVLKGCPLWIAKYGKNNGKPNYDPKSPSGFAPPKLWQYTSKGRCPGINGNVDMNLWYGPEAALEVWWEAHSG